MTTVQTKNKEFATVLSKFSVLFFKSVFKFLTAVCAFLKCAYQDYIFNRNYKRYLKYIDVYENLENDASLCSEPHSKLFGDKNV